MLIRTDSLHFSMAQTFSKRTVHLLGQIRYFVVVCKYMSDVSSAERARRTTLVAAGGEQNVEVMLTVLASIKLQQSHTRCQACQSCKCLNSGMCKKFGVFLVLQNICNICFITQYSIVSIYNTNPKVLQYNDVWLIFSIVSTMGLPFVFNTNTAIKAAQKTI